MKRRHWWYAGAAVSLSLIGAFVTHRVAYLVREPGDDKQCDPLFPEFIDASHTLTIDESALPTLTFSQKGGTINDASCVDETSIYGVVSVTSAEEIQSALAYARDHGLKVSLAGAKHSMGGHAFSKGNLVLDMTKFNAIELNASSSIITVQSGATWHDIQNAIHPHFAVMAMQSTDIFTVGGSISVNAHGMDHRSGAVENSIVSLRVLLPSGEIRTISRDTDTELYEHIVGGYGLYGIILSAELRVVPNDIYASSRHIMDYTAFPAYFSDTIEPNADIGLMYTHLSTAPGKSFLREAIVYVYTKSGEVVSAESIPPLAEISSVKLRRLVMNLSKQGPFWQQLRWWSEKYLEPKMESCSITRANAIGSGEACLVARNEPMHDSVPYLRNSLRGETDILHEYFVPRSELVPFIDGMRTIMEEHEVNLLNASIRVVNAERGALTYAPEPAFSIVLYINQKTDAEGHQKMGEVTRALIDLTHAHRGRFFLPYQTHYTAEQLRTSYPTIDTFFADKATYDPEGILTNTWYEKYRSDAR